MLRLGTLVVGFLACSSVLAAEPSTTEPSRDQRGPQIGSPYWNGGGAAVSDLPATDIRAVPPARAAAVHARWTYEQSRFDLSNATRMRMMELEATDEFRRAVNEEKTAYEAMENARREALAGLRSDPAYTAAQSLRRNISRQIEAAYAEPKPDQELINAMAQQKLDFIAQNRAREQQALADSSAYQEARRDYLAAAGRVSELRQDNALAIARDSGLQSLREQLADARIAKLASSAYLDSVVRARDIALDYAAFYRRIDRYRPYVGHGYRYDDDYPYYYGGRYVRY